MKNTCASLLILTLAACSGGGGGGGSGAPPPSGSPPPPPPPPAVNTSSETNVVYGQGMVQSSSKPLRLDIYQPSGDCTTPRPFVIGIHGGGFTTGSKTDPNWVTNMEALTARGVVGLSIEYRLTGDNPVVTAEFQPVLDDFNEEADRLGLSAAQREVLNAAVAAFEDTVTAMEWARDNADARCLDADRFALWGSSAGAFTALHVGHGLDEYFISRPDPLVVVDYWGGLLLDGLVDGSGPPLMIVHGTADTVVSYSDSAVPLANEADAAGLPYAFYTLQNAPHSYPAIDPNRVRINGETVRDVTLDFIEAHLNGGAPDYAVETVVWSE